MIKITCCRLGGFPKGNTETKGTFIKEFENMQQLASFMKRSWCSLFFPNISWELSKRERETLINKLESLRRKK